MPSNVSLVTAARARALFMSDLSADEMYTTTELSDAIARALRRAGGHAGCLAALAQRYGDDPETAPGRMRWALRSTQRCTALRTGKGGYGPELPTDPT